MEISIITIGRQVGSGGSYIGHEAAKRLGIECYDKRLIEYASQYGNLDEKAVRYAEEKRANPFFYTVPREAQNERTGRGIPINDMVFNLQSAVIEELAKKPCVIIGRCADYVLRGRTGIYSVFIYADMESRIKRICETRNLTEMQAEAVIRREDRERKKYYECYTGKKWGTKESYDICLNSGKFGLEYCIDLICAYYKK